MGTKESCEVESERKQETDSFDWVVCPACLGILKTGKSLLTCRACNSSYPVYAGIPDFRNAVDPATVTQGTWKEENQLLERMLEKFPVANLSDLLEEMLAGLENRTEADNEQLRHYFVGGLSERARHRALTIDLLCKKFGRAPYFSTILEIGCGAGATLFELSDKGDAVGIDPNFLHLLIAKKHAETIGKSVKLACAYAERLPFKSDRFTFIDFMHTLEHFSNQEKGLSEVHRVLSPGGLTCFDIPNRFSLWREPHTHAWGIGFLPREWTALDRILNQSFWKLRDLVRGAFGNDYAIYTMLIRFNVPGYEGGWLKRIVASLLQTAERIPLVRSVVRFFQPGFEVVARKESTP
jgi:SAM-dependent methyltransferase